MAKRLILLLVFFIYVTVHPASASGEGIYTDNVREIFEGMDEDHTSWHESENHRLKLVFLPADPFLDMCKDCTRDQKLSICIRAVQHKWKQHNPTSFTVNPQQLDGKCRIRNSYAGNRYIFKQRMYICPPTTVKMSGNEDTEPSFLISQGLHETQFRVRIFKPGDPATLEGQVTGLSFDRLNFEIENNNYVYTPGNDSGNAVTSFRSSGDIYDYRFLLEEMDERSGRRRHNIIQYERGY